MKPLQIVALAELEFREATTWYRDRDPRVADRFTDETRKALQLIATFPQIGGPFLEWSIPTARLSARVK